MKCVNIFYLHKKDSQIRKNLAVISFMTFNKMVEVRPNLPEARS